MSDGQPETTQVPADRGPGVFVRPPLLYAGTLVLALFIDGLVMPEVYRSFGFSGGMRFALGIGLLLVGIAFMAPAMRRFGAEGTPVRTSEATTTLVTTGIYRLSRNPIYMGLTANYLGICILTDTPVALALLIPVLFIMRFGVIAREERYLEGKYGETYRDFKRRTGRWLGPV